jgi:outer membrane protein assembly factor BamB
MSDWKRKLSEEELARILKDDAALSEVPAALREKTLERVSAARKTTAAAKKRIYQYAFFKPALAALAAIAVAAAAIAVFAPGRGAPRLAAIRPQDLENGIVSTTPAQALVVAVAGEARALLAGAWTSVAAGDLLEGGLTLKTGDASSCQLQFGGKAVVLVREKTDITLEALTLKASLTDIGIRVRAGGILCKVARLNPGERFTVRTKTAAGGVRGTEFAVTVSDDRTLLAVREGLVYLLPASLDPDLLRRTLAGAADKLDPLFAAIEEEAPVVAAGREAEIDETAAASLQTEAGALRALLEDVSRRPAPSDREIQDARRAIVERLAAVRGKAGAPRPLSPGNGRELDSIDRLDFLPAAVEGQEPPSGAFPPLVKIEVTTEPADAEIFQDGRPLGRGRFEGVLSAGTVAAFLAKKEGFQDASVTVAVKKGGPNTAVLKLEKSPEVPTPAESPAGATTTGQTASPEELKKEAVVKTIAVSKSALIGDLATDGKRVYAADRNGTVFAVETSGAVAWKLPTTNNPNSNSSPILIDRKIFFSGRNELVIADSASGNVAGRAPLESYANQMFGRHVVKAGGQGLLPTDTSLRLINLETGATEREITVPNGSRMTPLVRGGKAYLVDTTGALQGIDLATGAAEAPIRTTAAEPVAIGLAVSGNRVYFAGRKNVLACVDLASRRRLWEKSFTAPGYAYNDLVCAPQGVFIYAGKMLFGFSPNGRPLSAPRAGVSAPPALAGDLLYAGFADGRFCALDPASLSVRKTLTLKGAASARPVAVGRLLAVGLESGEIVLVDPGAM